MSHWNDPRVLQAAEFLDRAVRQHVLKGIEIHAATCLACSAWMAGTVLYRLEVDGLVDAEQGTVVLSEEVNARLPGFFNVIAGVAAQGEPADEATERVEGGLPVEKHLTLQQTREYLEPLYWAFAHRQGLSGQELLHAATLAAGVLTASCRKAMGLAAARHLAHHSMLEASKTAPGPRPAARDGQAHLKRLAAVLPPLGWRRRLALLVGR